MAGGNIQGQAGTNRDLLILAQNSILLFSLFAFPISVFHFSLFDFLFVPDIGIIINIRINPETIPTTTVIPRE